MIDGLIAKKTPQNSESEENAGSEKADAVGRYTVTNVVRTSSVVETAAKL